MKPEKSPIDSLLNSVATRIVELLGKMFNPFKWHEETWKTYGVILLACVCLVGTPFVFLGLFLLYKLYPPLAFIVAFLIVIKIIKVI